MQWVALERVAATDLRPRLRPLLGLSRAAHSFLTLAVSTGLKDLVQAPGHAAEVQARLLVRLSNDLRAVELLAVRSYVLQALSVAASVYEIAHAVAFIGGSDERARAWEGHTDGKNSYPSARDRRAAVRATLEALAPSLPFLGEAVDDQEALYQAFCVAKHGNPKALRRFGVTVEGKVARIYHGPFVASYVARQAHVALLHSARLVVGATLVFARRLMSGVSLAERQRYAKKERSMMLRLHAAMQSDPLRPQRQPNSLVSASSAVATDI